MDRCRLLMVGLLALGTLLGGCASDVEPSEENVDNAPHHEFTFSDVKLTELLVGLPGEVSYERSPIPCGLAVGSGPNVTSIRLAGSTALGANLKVDMYAGTKICRTMFFRATRFSTTYYSHQVYLAHSDSDTLSTGDAKPILFLEGTDKSDSFHLSLDLGDMHDKSSTKSVAVRGDATVKGIGKTAAPWSNKQRISFDN